MGNNYKPAWLESLYREKFFVGCSYHERCKKNEKNVYCLDCCISICPHCIPSHRHHRLLQVRRYVYHDVLRLQDLHNLIDCSTLQGYTINSAKVVFIKKRPQNRQFKGAGNYCTSCDRSLQEPYIHCSLFCKLDSLLKHYKLEKDLSQFLKRCTTLTLSPDYLIPTTTTTDHDDDGYSTVVDGGSDMILSSWSGSSSDNDNDMITVRKKRSGAVLYVCGRSADINYGSSSSKVDMMMSSDHEDMATSCMNRRKRIPHRSPLC